ncbi:MAG: hypothetical protein QXU32_05810 [Nitrososphaerales archaeon]
MNFANRSRLWTIFAAAILIIGGLAIISYANQNLAGGPLQSSLPSLGYERNLSFTEIGVMGILMVGIGVMLAFISIGIRKWPRYQPKEEYIDGVKAISISVASMNYEKEKDVIREVMRGAELLMHTKNEFIMSEPEYKMGWYFFVLHVSPNLVRKVIDLADASPAMKNMKMEDRFIIWLSERLEEKECNVYLDLESKKSSSKYGLF